jgi:hypothetical protein
MEPESFVELITKEVEKYGIKDTWLSGISDNLFSEESESGWTAGCRFIELEEGAKIPLPDGGSQVRYCADDLIMVGVEYPFAPRRLSCDFTRYTPRGVIVYKRAGSDRFDRFATTFCDLDTEFLTEIRKSGSRCSRDVLPGAESLVGKSLEEAIPELVRILYEERQSTDGG